MELQLAVQSARSSGRSRHVGTTTTTKDVPNYLKPSTGSCHHACKYGGTHTFEERDAPKAQPKARKQPPAAPDQQKSLIRMRLVPRKLFGDRSSRGNEKIVIANKETKKPAESVEWKDIVAYDTVPELDDKQPVMGSGDAVTIREKKSHGRVNSQNESPDKKLVSNNTVRSKTTMMTSKVSTEPTTHKNMNTDDTKRVRPPRGNIKKPAVLVVRKTAEIDPELVDGYHPISPSLLQKRASLLRDLEEEMVVGHAAAATATTNESKPDSPLDPDEVAAAETGRPVPAHRRAKSMSLSISRSVRFPFARQPSKNAAAFKLRSRSSKGPVIPPPDEATPTRSRRRGSSVGGGEDVVGVGGSGRGIQLRIRSLRRRGVGGGVVPAVALRHQKTLEKKRSQRLYNNVIEETASRLVKTRKSRVKALVGAFESVISKIAK